MFSSKYLIAAALVLCSLPAFAAKAVTLTWNASVTPGVTYNVYRSATAGSCFTTKIATGVAVLNYDDPTVIPGSTYFYSVSAQNTGGESTSCSNEVQIAVPTPPSAPTNLQGAWHL